MLRNSGLDLLHWQPGNRKPAAVDGSIYSQRSCQTYPRAWSGVSQTLEEILSSEMFFFLPKKGALIADKDGKPVVIALISLRF